MTWFVRNVREMKWWDRGPRGFVSDFHCDDDAQVGVNLFVLGPGEPMSMYHWEADQEGFLVLSGEAVLIVGAGSAAGEAGDARRQTPGRLQRPGREDEEHPLRQWDYFHCPPGVPHTIVGAGSGPSAILAIGAREKQDGPDWGGYPYSDVAMKHDASAEEATTDPDVAYARFPSRQDGDFREDWLPT
ncbi:MAG TPA: hypothetical protein VGK69_06125 [Gaiellaceae bacterium]